MCFFLQTNNPTTSVYTNSFLCSEFKSKIQIDQSGFFYATLIDRPAICKTRLGLRAYRLIHRLLSTVRNMQNKTVFFLILQVRVSQEHWPCSARWKCMQVNQQAKFMNINNLIQVLFCNCVCVKFLTKL